MAKKLKRLERALKGAIKGSGMSRYAIWQATGVDQAALSRFMAGKRGLNITSVELLLDLFDLDIVPRAKRRTRQSKGT